LSRDPSKVKVIAFANQKGGVAKTTTTLNLAVAFAEKGFRVLCVDMDPQGNLTMSQGIDPDGLTESMFDVLVHDMPIRQVIRKREVDIACASIDLAGAEIAMSMKIGASARWRRRSARSPTTMTSSASTRRPRSGSHHQRAHRGRQGHRARPVRVPVDARARPAAEHAPHDP
jgi:hypothetical protein